MNSVILKTITQFILVWMLIFSWWVLLRGHYAPGGGFIGGLIAACAFSLYLLAFGKNRLLMLIFFSPILWLGIGLLCMLISSFSGYLVQKSFLSYVIYGIEPINSTILFDIGIYLVVCFSILCMLIALERAR